MCSMANKIIYRTIKIKNSRLPLPINNGIIALITTGNINLFLTKRKKKFHMFFLYIYLL
ncbi:hypothetical protein BDF21DRAFT_2722 [Thamnidium elegans]|nr:hypothetical protein BDF21DRAFT_2722 [Thamnidium elegans]